jgi:hypothetical protein
MILGVVWKSKFFFTLCGIVTYNIMSSQSYVDYFCGAVANVSHA